MISIRHDYSVILRVSDSIPEILVITTTAGYTLPLNENPAHFWQTIEPVINGVLEKYNLHVTTIRCLEPMLEQGENQPLINVYLHRYQAGNIADNMRWIAIDSLPELNLPDVANNLQNWLDWLQSDTPKRQVWYQLEGIQQIVESVKARVKVAPEQLRSWERSSVWRIPTQEGNVYLKMVPPMFGFEPTLTRWLYQHFPECSTPVLNWPYAHQLLMADYGGQPLAPELGLAAYENVLATYARMQIAISHETELLKAIDVPYRPIRWIADRLEDFLIDDAKVKRGYAPLSDDDIQIIRVALPRLKKACAVLSDCAIPETLEHGDLWFGQIMMQDGKALFTDWSDGAITCPLFSLPFFIAEEGDMPQVPDAVTRITDAYLSEWCGFADRRTIDNLMPHVNVLSPLYTALRYHYDILPGMEIQWEMENMVTYNLRLLLKALAK